MSSLVAAFAVSHVPGHTVNPGIVPPNQYAEIQRAWSTLKSELVEAKPDLVVAISNDHFNNFFPVQPPFCVGSGDTHSMPSPASATRLKIPSVAVSGSPDFAQHLLDSADAHGFPLAFSDTLNFVDEISIPQRFLDSENTIEWLPILTNCLNRNRPSPRNFFKLGEMIAKAIAEDKAARRVAVIATGGLSHDPMGPNWCLIDETFDRRFLHLLEAGDAKALFAEYTLDHILKPGRGGTPEILNWFVALGAVGAAARATVHCYEPIPAWATGVGYASWPIDKLASSETKARIPA